MRTALIAMFAAALARSAWGAPDPGVLVTPGGEGGQWKPLVSALAAKGPILAAFSERRFFPFRSEPTRLEGILRMSPERGLSLQYVKPEASVMIADAAGLVLRDRGGRSREMPAGSGEAGAVVSLLPIMRFDFPALYPKFVIRFLVTGGDWRFEFTPRDPGVAKSLGSIAVAGTGTAVRHLEFRRSANQRVEIDVGETTTGVTFTPADLATFFR
jgi:hypothetical protein